MTDSKPFNDPLAIVLMQAHMDGLRALIVRAQMELDKLQASMPQMHLGEATPRSVVNFDLTTPNPVLPFWARPRRVVSEETKQKTRATWEKKKQAKQAGHQESPSHVEPVSLAEVTADLSR